jgi:hypothetical protein
MKVVDFIHPHRNKILNKTRVVSRLQVIIEIEKASEDLNMSKSHACDET